MSSTPNTDLVSIIIPTKGNRKMIERCVHSIEQSDYDNYEIILIYNSSVKRKISFINSRHLVMQYQEDFNFSSMNNLAVKKANGGFVVFLNDDTSVIATDWIERMLEHARKPTVGAVGAKLLYPNNTVQHAGVLIGVGGITSHAFEGYDRNEKGYNGLLQSVHECSAITAACLMMRKNVFQEVGGFDENLAYSFNDVDLCLRLRKKGYKIIYTPHAELYHYTTSTRPYSVNVKEIKYFIDRWRDLIIEGDPYYDQELSRIKPYSKKTKEEQFILTDSALLEESERRTLKIMKRYAKAAKAIEKQHGTRRLIVEFLRFLRIRGLRK
jgi:GT2 family glycosyltransferase